MYKIVQRISYAGHEAQILPHLHEAFVLCCSLFEKVNTEAARIGVIKRKLHLPPSEQFVSAQEMSNLVNLQFQVCTKLFRTILQFGKRYVNSQYSITLYLNMGRLINAESELNELMKSSEQLLSLSNFLRVQTACKVAWCLVRWIRVYRIQKERMLRAKRLKEQEKELLAQNFSMNQN